MTLFYILWQAAERAREDGELELAKQLYRRALNEVGQAHLLEIEDDGPPDESGRDSGNSH